MRKTTRMIASVTLALFSTLTLSEGAKVTPLIQKDLNDFKNKEGLMLTVEYAPGMSSKTHRHDAHVFIYMLEGAIVMQVKGSEPVTLRAGQSFYESPKDIHLVSKNASSTKPAKFVVFTLKKKDTPVVIPVKERLKE